jgi:hypothetical protein
MAFPEPDVMVLRGKVIYNNGLTKRFSVRLGNVVPVLN